MKIVLIGYRACGKSTVGVMLAAKLNVPFHDTDLLIEEGLGMSIKDAVAAHGWAFFRAREKEAVQGLAQKNSCVIATGGGVVLDPDNIAALKKMSIVIWLNAPPEDIIKRLCEDAQTDALRPQFTTGDLASETAGILKQRTALYKEAADFALDTADKNAFQVTEEIYLHLLESGILEKIN